jgi:DNA-binding transcriptional ArsR family regulator
VGRLGAPGHRARRLTEAGPADVFAGLHRLVSWDDADGALVVDRRYDETLDLAGRGLLLVPVVFAWPQVFAMTDPPWQPTLLYAPRGAGHLWEPEERPAPGALADLVGRRRAAVLGALDEPATTSALAARLGVSPASVSEHLGVLRRAGLVAARRDGRRVLYARTATGDALVG